MLSVSACDELWGQQCIYVYIWCIYVLVCMCLLVNACSALLLVGPVGMELWQPHVCWATEFGLPLLISSDVIEEYGSDKTEE